MRVNQTPCDQIADFFTPSGIGLEELKKGLWQAVEEFLIW
jgi:hypothetical protein